MSSRQEVKVEHKVSIAPFTSRNEKRVGAGREEDTTEERWEGDRELRFCLKVTLVGLHTTRLNASASALGHQINTVKETRVKTAVACF